MRHLTQIFAAVLALIATPIATPIAAQTIAYEDVLFTAPAAALLEEPEQDWFGPRIAYETPVELEVAQRSLTVLNRVQAAPVARVAAFATLARPQVTQVEYGPFRVLGQGRVALNGMIDGRSPGQFAQLLRDHPDVGMLEMVEAPGTVDDHANFRLARMLRSHAIVTYVPANGSVRSGAVELFLAGARRIAHRDAEFAVHSWMDVYGREAADFSDTDPVNRAYIDFYVEMGLVEGDARRFYSMTNSVPHNDALWLHTGDLARYVPIEQTS